MKTKAIIAGAVVLVAFLSAMLLVVSRKPPQAITVRHIKSVQSADTTMMTFEIKNRTANTYVFRPYEVQVRNGNAWAKFQGSDLDTRSFIPSATVGPTGFGYWTVNVTNLPANSVVRFSIRPVKKLSGLSGLFRRAELKWKYRGLTNVGPSSMPLNPYDRKSSVFGKPTLVTSDEFVETVK